MHSERRVLLPCRRFRRSPAGECARQAVGSKRSLRPPAVADRACKTRKRSLATAPHETFMRFSRLLTRTQSQLIAGVPEHAGR